MAILFLCTLKRTLLSTVCMCMFNKTLNNREVRYVSNDPKFKIQNVVFNWVGTKLLQIFGSCGDNQNLKSLDQGPLGDIQVCNQNIAVDCSKVSSQTLDLIFNELEVIEPKFQAIKAELSVFIQEKLVLSMQPTSASTPAGVNSNDVEKMKEALALQAYLQQHSVFSINRVESDYDKAYRLFNADQYEEALAAITKYKTEKLDSNPYGYDVFGRGPSVSKAVGTYKVMATCYKNMHQYADAVRTLQHMWSALHSVLSPEALQKIEDMRDEWQKEADEFAATQSRSARGQ